MRHKKRFILLILINILFFIATIITGVLYIENTINLIPGNNYTYKTVASSVFLLCSFTNIVLLICLRDVVNKAYITLLFIGQIFAFAGDVILMYNFVIGAISFAIGHVFYFFAYCSLQKFKLIDLVFIGVTIAISLSIIFAGKINLGSDLPVVVGYAIIISCMLGKSASLFLGNMKIATIIFIGSLMFYLSDMFLMLAIYSDLVGGTVLCLSFYYPAEFILASSVSSVSYLLKKEFLYE